MRRWPLENKMTLFEGMAVVPIEFARSVLRPHQSSDPPPLILQPQVIGEEGRRQNEQLNGQQSFPLVTVDE